MEKKKTFTTDEVPGGFAMCTCKDCKVADHCLRHMAFEDVGKDNRILCSVNPLKAVPTAECEYFRTDELATYARGFKNMQKSMIPGQYDTFMVKLIGKFGRTGYYERRRGQRLCSPSDIEAIRAVLQTLGLPDLAFDSYEKHYKWFD